MERALHSDTWIHAGAKGTVLTLTAATTWDFITVSDDVVQLYVLQMMPKDDTTVAYDSPTTMITLYFSESVQATTGEIVRVGPASSRVSIPADNGDPTEGPVGVSGATVTIDPFDDVDILKRLKSILHKQHFKFGECFSP